MYESSAAWSGWYQVRIRYKRNGELLRKGNL